MADVNMQIQALIDEDFIITQQSKSPISSKVDKLTIEIPYSISFIKIRLLMDPDPLRPPDIIVISPSNISVDYQTILSAWDASDKNSLLNICKALKEKMSELQMIVFDTIRTKELDAFYNISRNIDNLPLPLEIYVIDINDLYSDIVISIPLPIRLSSAKSSRCIYAEVTIKQSIQRFGIDLNYPSWATQFHHLTIRSLVKQQNPLWLYDSFYKIIYQLLKTMEREVYQVESAGFIKRDFFHKLWEIDLGVPVEVDSEDFSFIAFCLEIKSQRANENIIIHVSLNNDFPRVSPSYRFFSVRNTGGTKMKGREVPRMRGWDEHSTPEKMASITKQQIIEEIKSFYSINHL